MSEQERQAGKGEGLVKLQDGSGAGLSSTEEFIQKRILAASRVAIIFLILIFISIAASLVVLVPKAVNCLEQITAVVEEIHSSYEVILDTVKDIDELVEDVRDSYDVVIDTVRDIDETVQGINQIDFDAFSEAVNHLTSVVNTIGSIFK